MENGTLIILQGKKGKVAKISFQKQDGKTAEMPVPGYTPKDDRYNNTPCTFKRDKGQLVELIAHDGAVLWKAQPHSVIHAGAAGPVSQGAASGIADSFDPGATFLPADAKAALARAGAPDNFALKLFKAARFDARMNKFQFFKREKKGENYSIRAEYGTLDFSQIAARAYSDAQALLGHNNLKKLELTTDWRLIQGLGIESVYEVAMTLHHVYGIPYIPASALKGVVRGWIITEYFEGLEEKALSDPRFCNWFGCPAESFYKEARQGQLVFFDVFPLTPPIVEPDVMNPHYQAYYSDKSNRTAPSDFLSPNPVFFLTVARTKFQILAGSRNKEALQDTIGGKTMADWLRDALENHGIGAKTAVGYGYFQ